MELAEMLDVAGVDAGSKWVISSERNGIELVVLLSADMNPTTAGVGPMGAVVEVDATGETENVPVACGSADSQ